MLKDPDLLEHIRGELQDITHQQMDTDDVIKQIKSLMWTHRSSITVKTPLFPSDNEPLSSQDQQLLELFQSLEKRFDRYSEFRIRKLLT